MEDVTRNPYESPSVGASEEAAAPPTRFNARERRTIERFVWMNQVIAGCVIAVGIGVPTAAYIGFASRVSGLDARFVIRLSVAMLAVVALGIFQGRRNLAAMTITGAIALLSFLSVIVLAIRTILAGAGLGVLGALPCVGPVAVVTLFPPMWLAIQAWHWRLRGVDLQVLSKVKYTDVSKLSDAHFRNRSAKLDDKDIAS